MEVVTKMLVLNIVDRTYLIIELILYCAKQVKLNMYTGIANFVTVYADKEEVSKLI